MSDPTFSLLRARSRSALSQARAGARTFAYLVACAAALIALSPRFAVAQQPPRPPATAAAPAAAAVGTGRLAGRVIDAQTGLPIPGAQIVIEARPEQATTDLDGRFRTGLLPEGKYTVRARRLGLGVRQYEGIVVTAGQTTVVNFGLTPAATALAAVAITAEQTDRASSAAGLLGAQQRAAAASDGISAEQITRTPDSDAGAAAQRVSGVSVVDNKFVVVRGLAERYSNTLLNGVEVTSPEPTKKIVPLDIFPAALLDAIVVTKSATPDKPGDFSGGSVEIRTKEFPENNVRSVSLSAGYNDRSTFETARMPEQRGLDRLGFDDGRRAAPPLPRSDDPAVMERFAESIRRDWNPAEQSVAPNLRLTMNAGGRAPGERLDLGYVLALTYSADNRFDPLRFSQTYTDPDQEPERVFVYRDARRVIDWGAVANVAVKLGSGTKLGLKNLYTRNAEELYSTADGFNNDRNGDLRGYQFQYVERDLLQSQLTGDHLIKLLFRSRVEWKATYGASNRNEPDNRQLLYLRAPESSVYVLGTNNDAWFRFLDDRQVSGQLDWNIPLRLRRSADALLKVGGLMRRKDRAFESNYASIVTEPNTSQELLALPPEKLFLPEIVGNILKVGFPGNRGQPYDADDDLLAYYGMLDIPLLTRLRVVGGARMEQWSLDLYDGGRDRSAADSTVRPTTIRRNNDLLWSANVTYSLSDRMNLRLAAFRSVARPDTRELSRDEYTDVVGGCPTIGNPSLRRSLVVNSDVRWEWYPNPGEIVAISGFFKDFDSPIVRSLTTLNRCTFTFHNAISAQLFGGEIDMRKELNFLPGPLSRLTASMNFTVSQSTLVMDPQFGEYDEDLQLEGQSPFLANAGLTYANEDGSTNATLLYSFFDDRIARYGFASVEGQGPNVTEKGRGQLDLKIQKQLRGGIGLSLAARNLTGAVETYTQQLTAGETTTGRTIAGRTFSLGISLSR